MQQRLGQIVVIFRSILTGIDADGYTAAATAMENLAAGQPGYRGFDSVRGADGRGITISYSADDTTAKAWRDHPEHTAIRDAGRARWYQSYDLVVAEVIRDYDWQRA